MVTTAHIAFRAMSWALIGISLALVLFMLRLHAGPIELDWLKPRIERALTPEQSEITVTAGHVELRFDKEERTLDLVGVDVRYQANQDGQGQAAALLVFPEVDLAFSVEALLKQGMIAASSIHLRAPSLVVVRNDDGVIDLRPEGYEGGDTSNFNMNTLVKRFADPTESDKRFSFLKTLQISGGRIAFYDRLRALALTTKDADLMLSRRDGGVDGWLRADILQGSGGPASAKLSARIEPNADQLPFEFDVVNLMPADLQAIWPLLEPAIPAELGGLRLPVQASIKGEIGPEGKLSPLLVDVKTSSGIVDLPAYLPEPLEIQSAEFKGTVAGDLGAVEIDQAMLISRGSKLSGAGHATWRESEPALNLDLVAHDVGIAEVLAFWPNDLGPRARAWVEKNITAGRVPEAKARLDLRPIDFGPAPLRDEAVGGSFKFEELSVRYVDEMPPLENASGQVEFDAHRMAFDVDGGSSADVTLNGGSVTITDMGKPESRPTQLHVLADIEASIEHMLTLLDHKPLEIATKIGLDPKDIAGDATSSLVVHMPLHAEVKAKDALVVAEAELSGLAIDRLPKVSGDIGLDQGEFKLDVGEDTVRLDGSAEINGIPLAINITEQRKEEERATRRIDVAGRLSQEQLEDQGWSIDGLEGDFRFEATVTETETYFWVDLKADLAALGIGLPGLAWTKPKGQEGLLRASVALPIDGPLEVKQFELASGDLKTSGTLSLLPANDGLASLTLDSFRLADSDAAIRLTHDGDDGYDILVEAARLDFDAIFGEDREVNVSSQPFHIAFRADQLRTRGIELANVEAGGVHRADGWLTGNIVGSLPSSGEFELELLPDGDDRRLLIKSENAGALIKTLDLGQQIDGGELLLTARLKSQDPVMATGRFEITGFVLEDAPLLARMLTLASLTGIGNLLGGEGIQIDHLVLPFTLNDQKLTFTDGLMRGSQLGLTLKGDVELEDETLDLAGTIIPVYSLNRLIGQVPVIGRILTGIDGRGAFAATYALTGPQSQPSVYVNPLAMIAPGLLRDFVGGLLNGTLEPPDFRDQDD